MRKYLLIAAVVAAVGAGTTQGVAQTWLLGGDVGLSLIGGAAGFHVTPAAEMRFNGTMGVGSEFSINTQYGAPLLWYPYFRYYFGIPGSQIKPYAGVGPVMALNVPNGPCFGFLFQSGVSIPVAHRLYLAPNVMLGSVFGYGGGAYPFILRGYYWGYETYGLTSFNVPSVTAFAFSVRAGIRYEL